jgi:DHA2 family multidrug resistance protein
MLRSERRSAAPAPATAPDSVVEYGARRVLIVTGVMLAALLQTLDATIVNVALPTIEGNIGAAIDDGTWIITGYIISNVIAIPLAPYFLQRLGRRQYFALCIIGFTVASFLCGTATSLGALVAYRVVQGAFGGGLVATSQIILRDTFEPKEIGASSALFAIALTVGPALGPTLGGILTDAFSWQWVFDINLVPGIAAAIIILTNLRNPLPPRALPFDGIGVALLALGLGSLQYVLDEGERHDWFDDRTIVTFAVLCVAGLTAFVLWELFGTPKPIVDLRIFRYRNVRFGVLGFTATLSGLLILMRALPVLLLTPLVARLATRLDVRQLLTAGFLLSSLSFVLLSARMTTTSDFTTFIAVLVISGAAQAMLLVPLLVSIIGSVAPADAPKSSSFVSLSVQLGGSIASTMLVTIFDRRTFFHSEIYRSSATFANAAVVHLLTLPHGRALLARIIALQASNSGFADSIAALIPAALVTLLPIWCLRVAARKPAVAIPIAK